jgi:hypothetical protein
VNLPAKAGRQFLAWELQMRAQGSLSEEQGKLHPAELFGTPPGAARGAADQLVSILRRWADSLAARVARDGDPEDIHFEETDTNFAIGWKGSYQIDGDAFVFIDRDTARVTTILGYPTRRLAQVA